jgi:hypothetical protein
VAGGKPIAVWSRSASDSHHHHRPQICLCFHLQFSSITRHLHAHSFYFYVILHKVHPCFPPSAWPLLGYRSTFILITLFVKWLSYLLITCPYQAKLLFLIFSNTGATFKFPLIYSFLILSILVTPSISKFAFSSHAVSFHSSPLMVLQIVNANNPLVAFYDIRGWNIKGR